MKEAPIKCPNCEAEVAKEHEKTVGYVHENGVDEVPIIYYRCPVCGQEWEKVKESLINPETERE
jgi:hypothetical protein